MRPYHTTLTRIGRPLAWVGLAAATLLWLAAAGAVGSARAADVSAWDGDERGAVRLIAGSRVDTTAGSALRAGVEIRLGPGWNTYWRYPGDAGVPPRFDFSGSQNLGAVEVRWPAPQRLDEDGFVSIGYHDDVVFPLRVTAKDAAAPVELRLKLDYAICQKLCVPARAKIALTVSGQATTQDATLAEADALVPRPVALGQGDALAIKAVHREQEAGRPLVVVDVAAPPDAEVELFAEGPTPEWALPVPEPVAGAPSGLRRFAFDLDGAPPGAKTDGISLKLTAVAGDQAIEVVTPLD